MIGSSGVPIKGIIFDIPGEPVAKPRMTRSDKWKQRPAVLKYREYADRARAALQGIPLPATPGVLDVAFAIPMPASWSKRKRAAMQNTPHTAKPDIDNLVKAVMDSLYPSGDSSIHTVTATKFWGHATDPELAAYTLVTLEPLEEA